MPLKSLWCDGRAPNVSQVLCKDLEVTKLCACLEASPDPAFSTDRRVELRAATANELM